MSHHPDHNDEYELEEEESEEEEENHTLSIIRNAVAAVIMITALILEHTLSLDTVCMVLFLAVYIITGYSVIWGALKRTLKLSFFDEQQLMTIATVGAIIIGSVEEAAAVMLLYSIGELLEDYITDRSNDSVKELLASIPNTAHLIPDIDNPHETVDTEPDEIGIEKAYFIRDLFDCRTCANHIAQVYLKGIMDVFVIDKDLILFMPEKEVDEKELSEYIKRVKDPQTREKR